MPHPRRAREGWWAVSERSDAIYKLASQLKRARKAAKREEDARRTAEGRTSAAWAVGALGMPYRAGFWDYHEGVWSGHYSGRLRSPPRMWLDVREPRWRQRLDYRRSLPWVGRTCVGSYASRERSARFFAMLRDPGGAR